MNIIPSRDNYLVEILEDVAEKTSSGGIIIKEANEYRTKTTKFGKILAVGNGFLEEKNEHIHMTYQVDAVVIFPQFSGSQVDIDYSRIGKLYVINQSQIQGHVEK